MFSTPKTIGSFFILLAIFLTLFTPVTSIIELPMKKMDVPQIDFQEKLFTLVTNDNKNVFFTKGSSIIDLIGLKDGLYTIKVLLGDPLQEFEVIVDTGSFLLWIPSSECRNCFYAKSKFDYRNSKTANKTMKSLQLKYISGVISGNISDDKFSLGGNLSLNKFNFLLSNVVDAPVKVDGIIGFARKYSHYGDDFSLIQTLYNSGVIKQRIFSQKIITTVADNSTNHESKFFIGELPNEIVSDIENYSSCKAISNISAVETYWSCNLKMILLSNKKNEMKLMVNSNLGTGKEGNDLKKSHIQISNKEAPAIFDTGSNVIMGPEYLYEQFKNVYFKEQFKKGICFDLYDHSNVKGFRCNEELNKADLPSIHFVFDNDISYELPSDDIFIKDEQGHLFRIIFSKVPGAGWLLGQPFLKEYHVVFDHDADSIGLYHENKNEQRIIKLSEMEIDEVIDLELSSDKKWNILLIIDILVGSFLVILLITLSCLKIKRILKNKSKIGETTSFTNNISEEFLTNNEAISS